jgi:GNAT superfamily N-acetyltransferase
MSADPRAAMVEQHYVSLFSQVDTPHLRRMPDEDVLVYLSELPLPIGSGAVAPHFAPGRELQRTGQVLDVLFANGYPFQWWTGPLSHRPDVAELVESRGLLGDGPTPGMHADLGTAALSGSQGRVAVERCQTHEEVLEANRVFTAAFGMPEPLAETFVELWSGLAGAIQLVARVDGVPVGCAAGIGIDGVMGVYNVGTLESARRQGVGRAVTLELMRMGREQGCHSSILHASELGYPVYRALGYEHVTDVHQCVWVPQG